MSNPEPHNDKNPDPELQSEERQILLHTLGYNCSPRELRNRYCSCLPATHAMQRLEMLGLMQAVDRRQTSFLPANQQYFVATEAGQLLAEKLQPQPKWEAVSWGDVRSLLPEGVSSFLEAHQLRIFRAPAFNGNYVVCDYDPDIATALSGRGYSTLLRAAKQALVNIADDLGHAERELEEAEGQAS